MSREQTASYMRDLADKAQANDVTEVVERILGAIEKRAAEGYYQLKVTFPEATNDRNAVISTLERLGYKIIQYSLKDVEVSWS